MKEGRIRPSLRRLRRRRRPAPALLNEGGSNSTLVAADAELHRARRRLLNEGGSNSTLVGQLTGYEMLYTHRPQ